MKKIHFYRWLLISLVVGLSGCSLVNDKQEKAKLAGSIPVIDPQHSLAQQRSCGNKPYRAAGNVYQVLPSAKGYRAEGLATVYQGRAKTHTAGCEVLDLLTYVAAHKTLPLPSYVRVINRQNGLSVVVRVNDRGPFHTQGLIHLSPTAAKAIGISSAGGAVIVEGISEQTINQVNRSSLYVPSDAGLQNSNKSAQRERRIAGDSRVFYVIVGRYPTQAEAVDTFIRLASAGLGKAEMATAMHKGQQVHQVRVGPLYTQDQIDNVKSTLASNGLTTFRVVGIKN